jgi:hypothetical protein
MIEGMMRLATVTKNRVSQPLAKRQPHEDRQHHGERHHHGAQHERAPERRPDVDRAQPFRQLVKPVQRYPAQRERQPTLGALETQHEDRDHRPVHEQHEQGKDDGQRPVAGGALFADALAHGVCPTA